MSKTTLILVDQDVDAFIDDELSTDRKTGLMRAADESEAITDRVLDKAALHCVLRAIKQDIYEADPDLHTLIRDLLARPR